MDKDWKYFMQIIDLILIDKYYSFKNKKINKTYKSFIKFFLMLIL